ncbi:MAG: GntR family transcriptional regulator [Micromonosporaceae bacterium]|jgi:DNA-binding GntR family transcriptional regulator|nr:GntR family transcriptional regulator [Micromonosporaceae bacterium]
MQNVVEQEQLPEAATLLDTLRMAIYHGELTPGQRLIEAEVASRYDASRGAVREALALLSNEGLVVRERNRGARVRPVSLEEAIEITEARAVLEGLCAAKAAEAITARERRELKALATPMSDAVRKNDIIVYNQTSQQVHIRVREIAKQATVSALLDRLRYQSVRYQFHVALLPGRPAQGLKEHLAIINAVCSGDPDAAEKTMREHLFSVIEALRRLAELGPSPLMPPTPWR